MKKTKQQGEIMKTKHKYINGTKGVISIFLSILMLPFTIFVGALVNANRINSSAAIFDEALCNAANSTLGTYSPFLKKRFGLLAIKYDVKGTLSQNDVQEFISGIFSDYMQINCGALSNTFLDAEYEAKGVYPLSDPNVMKEQILEFGKYAVPKEMVQNSFDLNKLISSIESHLPGYSFFDTIKSCFNTTDSFVTLAENIDALKDRAGAQDTVYQNYEKAYDAFAAAVTSYQNAKTAANSAKSDMDAKASQAAEKKSAYENAKKQADDAQTNKSASAEEKQNLNKQSADAQKIKQ